MREPGLWVSLQLKAGTSSTRQVIISDFLINFVCFRTKYYDLYFGLSTLREMDDSPSYLYKFSHLFLYCIKKQAHYLNLYIYQATQSFIFHLPLSWNFLAKYKHKLSIAFATYYFSFRLLHKISYIKSHNILVLQNGKMNVVQKKFRKYNNVISFVKVQGDRYHT